MRKPIIRVSIFVDKELFTTRIEELQRSYFEDTVHRHTVLRTFITNLNLYEMAHGEFAGCFELRRIVGKTSLRDNSSFPQANQV